MSEQSSKPLTMDKVLFFLIRHGETAGNRQKIYRGWSNAPAAQLSQGGKKDAKEAGEYLRELGAQVQCIIADSLDRVVETCELVGSCFPDSKLELARALHPLNMGDFTLKSKDKYPVEPYQEDPSLIIPGGESVASFNERQSRVFKVIFDLASELNGGKVVVGCHGSNVSFLYNHWFHPGEPRIGYEGLVNPGGVVAVTSEGMFPLLKVRDKGKAQATPDVKLKAGSGTPTVGFVTWSSNKGPRQCGNCEYEVEGECGEEHVKAAAGEVLTAHPKMDDGTTREILENGRVTVAPRECCNWYEPKEGK